MKQLQTIDADTLLSTPLPVTKFIVEGLLPEGLHILAGSSQIGKSWLALWICLFVLKRKDRSSPQAELHCTGRDIESRVLELCFRKESRTWELSKLTELSTKIDPAGTAGITPKKVARQILQSVDALREIGITATTRRSNGKRIIELHSAESVDSSGTPTVGTIDPVGVVTACPPV